MGTGPERRHAYSAPKPQSMDTALAPCQKTQSWQLPPVWLGHCARQALWDHLSGCQAPLVLT